MASSTIKRISYSKSGDSLTFPDGLILKWGDMICGSRTGHNITFDKAFPNTCFGVFAQCKQIDFASFANISCSNASNTGFRLYQINSAEADMSVLWMAVGY